MIFLPVVVLLACMTLRSDGVSLRRSSTLASAAAAERRPAGVHSIPIHAKPWHVYTFDITVGGKTLEVMMDTGSAALAVYGDSFLESVPYSGKAPIPCEFYHGTCDVESKTSQYYATGDWNGDVCKPGSAEIGTAGLSAGSPYFAKMTSQDYFVTTCSKGPAYSGIAGFSFPGTNDTLSKHPLMDALVAQSGIKNIVAFQFCPVPNDAWADVAGTMNFGGPDPNLHVGELQVAAVNYTCSHKVGYWALNLDAISVVSKLPDGKGGSSVSGAGLVGTLDPEVLNTTEFDAACSCIVDTGNYGILLVEGPYDAFKAGVSAGVDYMFSQAKGASCFTKADVSASLPTLRFKLSDGFALEVTAAEYFLLEPGVDPSCIAKVSSFANAGALQTFLLDKIDVRAETTFNNLGQVVLEQYYTVFDRDDPLRPTVSFGKQVECHGVQADTRSPTTTPPTFDWNPVPFPTSAPTTPTPRAEPGSDTYIEPPGTDAYIKPSAVTTPSSSSDTYIEPPGTDTYIEPSAVTTPSSSSDTYIEPPGTDAYINPRVN